MQKGVRQGDPLSPLLLLQSVVNDLLRRGHLTLPIPCHDPDFPIVQYTDDTILIMPAEVQQVLRLKEALKSFSQSTGLDINYNKSSMIPINLDEVYITELANVFGCQVGKLPFTYLALPVGTTRPKIVDFLPLVDCMERRLTASYCFLNHGGKLQLLNSVISSMPTYFLCSLHIPTGITKQLERIQRQCLWRKFGKDSGKSLAAWDLICKPKNKGGLGIMNITLQNEALLIKHLHKFYNQHDTPWVKLIWDTYYYQRVPHATRICGSFWWKDICKLMDKFLAVSKCSLADGATALFWTDYWLDNSSEVLATKFARLFSFTHDKLISFKEVCAINELTTMFQLPLSEQAFSELNSLQSLIDQYHNRYLSQDVWSWRFGSKGMYSTKKFYTHVYDPLHSNPL